MRYYRIDIIGAPSPPFSSPNFGYPFTVQGPSAQWTSIAYDGTNDPGAQQIEFQIEEYPATEGGTPSSLTIFGVSFDQMRSSDSLVGKIIYVYGGMHSKSLPLSNWQSQFNGLLMIGEIIQTTGSWIGTEMSITLIFVPAAFAPGISAPNAPAFQQISNPRSIYDITGTPPVTPPPSSVNTSMVSGDGPGVATFAIGGGIGQFFAGGVLNPLGAPLNIVHNLQPNQWLGSAISETLSRAFPHATLDIRISGALKQGSQDSGSYQNVEQYASYIKQLSQKLLGAINYYGVHMVGDNNTIHVFDLTVPGSPGHISGLELIGQPAWIRPMILHIKTVLRGDIHVPMTIQLDPTITQGPLAIGGAGTPPQKWQISVAGTFEVTRVYHVGDFRNPDGGNWSTNIDAYPTSFVTPKWLPNPNVDLPSTLFSPFGGSTLPQNIVPPTPIPNAPTNLTPQRARMNLRANGR